MARVRQLDGIRETALADAWECASSVPGAVSHPSALPKEHLRWFAAPVPGTMASALAAASAWDMDHPRDFDAEEWWLRCKFRRPPEAMGVRTLLRFGGLATVADAWLDGEHILHSDNMFHEHEVELGERTRDESELVVRFAALPTIDPMRPRARWRGSIVTRQQLRGVRTALLGRMPAFHPLVAPVGAYRPVTLVPQTLVAAAELMTHVEDADGIAEVTLHLRALDGARIERVLVAIGSETAQLSLADGGDGSTVASGVVRMPAVALWWPFTHGQPVLHEVGATVTTTSGETRLCLGRTGFRTVSVDRVDSRFGLRVNGVDVFCRGASWMPLDPLGLTVDFPAYRRALEQVRDAGMNMLRVSGITLYEAQDLYDLCDEMGVMVWQDFMFANMDYPGEEETFRASVRTEATQFLDRTQASPCIVVLSGNSEVTQQAAMLGLSPTEASNPTFRELLPTVSRSKRPDVPYVETTPFGGAPPFRADVGVSHYYGVGAYRRPIEDARRARVRFAAECLAFANVPCDETMRDLLGDAQAPTGEQWKSRVPRDRGASWDFEDVRDHYLQSLFEVDPRALRSDDVERYIELSRLATGEVMARAMTEWRRSSSECRGALVWTLRDLWPGPGWGIIDARGRPKAAYHFLKRALQPVALLATDEGLNGLLLHAINDTPKAREGRLRLVLYRLGEVPVADETVSLTIPAHGSFTISDAEVLGRFVDVTYAYRFGPPGHDLAVATLVDLDGRTCLGQAFYTPPCAGVRPPGDPGVEAVAERSSPEAWQVTVRSKRFAQAVALDAPGFVGSDDFFHVAPEGEHVVTLRGTGDLRGARLKPANAAFATKILTRSRKLPSLFAPVITGKDVSVRRPTGG